MQRFDLVTIGDSILDTFLSLHSGSDFATFDKEKQELCIRSGSKVMLDEAQFCIGGNASNVAVGLSRLGFSTALIAELGDDEFSEKLTRGLTKEKVHLDLVKRSHADSTFSVIVNMLGDRTAFIRHVVRDHNLPLENFTTKWLYLTSVGKEWHTLYKKVLDYKKVHDATLIFNPGSAQIAEGLQSFMDVLALTDILIINRDEAEIILYGKIIEKEKEETEENVLFRIQRLGPKMVVMTDGDHGSFVMDEKAELFFEKSAKTTIVEKTGAGDAYSSGFVGALLSGKNLTGAMQWGAANAASVIEHVGAQEGLLTKERIISRMAKDIVKPKEL